MFFSETTGGALRVFEGLYWEQAYQREIGCVQLIQAYDLRGFGIAILSQNWLKA